MAYVNATPTAPPTPPHCRHPVPGVTSRRPLTPPTMRRAALLALALPAALACSGGGTDPAPDTFEGRAGRAYINLPGRPFGLAVTPDGAVLVTHQDTDRLTRIARDDLVARASIVLSTDPGDVLTSPDGSRIVVSAFISGNVHFLNAAPLAETRMIPLGPNAYRLALSEDGSRVFVTTTAGKVFALRVADPAILDSVQLAGSLQGIARHPNGTIAVASTAGSVTLLDPATLDTIRSRTIPPGAQDIVFSRDGGDLFVALESAVGVLVLDGVTLAPRDTIAFTGALDVVPFGLALSPDGSTLLVGSAATGTLAIVDLPARTVRSVVALGGAPRRIRFSADGGTAYVANEADRVDIIR